MILLSPSPVQHSTSQIIDLPLARVLVDEAYCCFIFLDGRTLNRMSVLGSVFLGLLAAAPAAVESVTHLTALRGFAGTSVLIMVGVAQDTARKVIR